MPGVVTVVTCLQLTKAAHVRLPAVSRAVPDAWSQPLEAVRRQQVCPGCRKSGLPVTLLCSGCAWVVTVWRALHPGPNQLPVPTGQGGDTPGDTAVDTGGLALPHSGLHSCLPGSTPGTWGTPRHSWALCPGQMCGYFRLCEGSDCSGFNACAVGQGAPVLGPADTLLWGKL